MTIFAKNYKKHSVTYNNLTCQPVKLLIQQEVCMETASFNTKAGMFVLLPVCFVNSKHIFSIMRNEESKMFADFKEDGSVTQFHSVLQL